MKLLQQIKTAMRISHNQLDVTFDSDIQTAALDLYRSGVQPYVTDSDGKIVTIDGQRQIIDDELIHKAIELYVKAQNDYNGKGEQLTLAYQKLSDSLALCGDYRLTPGEENV